MEEKIKKGFWSYLVKNFNMLWFIMALGLGGTGVAGFAVLNYTVKRTPELKGLLGMDTLGALSYQMGGWYQYLFEFLKYEIGIFGILHLIAVVLVFSLFFSWRKKYPEKYKEITQSPEKNSVTITPALTLGMTFNVFLAGGYFYFNWISENLQSLMGLAFGVWILILLYNMVLGARILKNQFVRDFDVEKMHFGWLLIPMSMAMAGVSGSGIAALATDPVISRLAFSFSLIPFSMAVFLTLIKVFTLFKSHYKSGLPSKIEFLPSFFIVMPIITLLSITLFRYGHFADAQFGGHLPGAYFSFVTVSGWAFMFWYMILGLFLLKDYFKNHYFDIKYFDESQWAFVCPVVAFATLGAFVYKTTLPFSGILWVIAVFLAIDVLIIGLTVYRQFKKLRMGFKNIQ